VANIATGRSFFRGLIGHSLLMYSTLDYTKQIGEAESALLRLVRKKNMIAGSPPASPRSN